MFRASTQWMLMSKYNVSISWEIATNVQNSWIEYDVEREYQCVFRGPVSVFINKEKK